MTTLVPHLDADLVHRLVAEQFPRWSDLPVRPVQAGGWDNRTFHLGDRMTVRLPSAVGYQQQVDKEHRWLPVLASQLPLPVPVPLAKGRPGAGYPFSWSIYRWIDGEQATADRITDLTQFAIDLAGFLTALQRADPTGGPAAGAHSFYRGGPLLTYDQETRDAIATLGALIPADTATEIWQAALDAPWDGPPVWFHGDIAHGNLLVRDGRLAAVIDFGTSGVGDPFLRRRDRLDAVLRSQPRDVPRRAGHRSRQVGARPWLDAVEAADHPRRVPRDRPPESGHRAHRPQRDLRRIRRAGHRAPVTASGQPAITTDGDEPFHNRTYRRYGFRARKAAPRRKARLKGRTEGEWKNPERS